MTNPSILLSDDPTLLLSKPTPPTMIELRPLLLLLSVTSLAAITLFAFRHIFVSYDASINGHLNQYGEWQYLWDDAKNFHANPHLLRPAFNLKNIRWAWTDGEILGVWEPVSLMLKMILHDVVDFANQNSTEAPRRYRQLSVIWHTLNVMVAFGVGRMLIWSVCDYEYRRGCLAKTEKEPKKNGKNGTKGKQDKSNAQRTNQKAIQLERLSRQEMFSTLGLWLGTLIFFAVHPLQAQTIGWISCLSYIFSCTFALMSLGGYIMHRDILRRWRRCLRHGENKAISKSGFHAPFRIIPQLGPSSSSTGRKKMGKNRRGTARSHLPIQDGHETFLFTYPKVFSLLCYVCATLCKSPAVTLPLVFIIVDVFLYSYPLYSFPDEHDADEKQSKSKGNPMGRRYHSIPRGLNMLLPQNVISAFANDAFPKLWRLTLRAIASWLPFLLTSLVVTIFLVRGNSKNLLDIQTPFERLEKSVWALCWYATKIVNPSYLVAAVEKWSFSFLDRWEVAASLVVVPYVTLVVLAYSTASASGRVVACAYGCFVAILLPSLGFIQHGRLFLAADRYAYLPLLIFGPCLAAIFGALGDVGASTLFCGSIPLYVAEDSGSVVKADLANHTEISSAPGKQQPRKPRLLLMSMLSVALLGIAAFFSVIQTAKTLLPWRNSKLLWSKNTEIFPETENAHVNLAAVFANDPKTADLDKAYFHAKEALRLRPDSPKYKLNLGLILQRRKEWDEVIVLLSAAVKDHPMKKWTPMMHKTLGVSFWQKGELLEAKQHLEVALALGDKSAQPDLTRLESAIKKTSQGDAK